MAKNIEMNWFNGSGYEALYPSTNTNQVTGLQDIIDDINSTISNKFLSLSNAINNNYDDLVDIINSKGINFTPISRVGVGSNSASLTLPFVPEIMFCVSSEIEEGGASLGLWYNGKWTTSARDRTVTFSAVISNKVMSWSWGGAYDNSYLDDKNVTYTFLLIP